MLNYLKRRFSSTELINEIQSGMRFGGQQEQQTAQSQSTQRPPQDYKYLPEQVRKQTVEEMCMQGAAEGQGQGPRMPFPSAPSSPTKQASVSGSGYGGAGSGGFMNTVTGQLTKAKHLFSTETLSSIISDVKVPGAMSGSKCKVLLVIDHPLTDWAKYIPRRKIDNNWDVRVEQAQLNDISISACPNQGCVVTVQDGRSARSQARTFKPDFVLIRQGLGVATQHYENLITGLMFGTVPCMNSVEAVYNMRNKAWLFSNLLKIQNKIGATEFPLIARSYLAKSQPLQPDFPLPVTVRLGGDSARECEVRVEDTTLFHSLTSLANSTQRYATTEPCIQSVCEVFIQKIGPFVKAFMRKPISNPSFGSSGSTVLEKIPVTPKHVLKNLSVVNMGNHLNSEKSKRVDQEEACDQVRVAFNQWITEISQLFGGLDMCAVKALQNANGDYYIQDVYGSDFLLLGDGQDEDRARIAELLIQKMEYVHKTSTGTSRKISQSQSSSGLQSVFSPSNPPQDQIVESALGQTQTTQQPSYSMQDQQMRLSQVQQSSFGMQDLPSRPQPPRQPSLSDQQRPQKPPAPNATGSSALQDSGRQNMSGGSVDFGQSRPLLQTQQKAQSIFNSPSQASRNEFSSRDSFDRSKIATTMTTSMDFSSTPSQSSRMNFGRDNEDTFGVGSTGSSTTSMLRSNIEGKTSDPWSTGPSRSVREPSLDGAGRKKEAAPQPPRQPSLTNSFDNRNFDTFGGSSGSSASVTSTNIFDPSANIFQPQTQSKSSSALGTFQSQSQGIDTGGSMKFDSPSMDFGQSLSKSQHNDPWSVPQSQIPFSQTSQFSSVSNTSMSGTSSTVPRPRPTTQQSSGNPDDGEDTMKNLRKTFAGIFGDI